MKVYDVVARVLKDEGVENLVCYPRQALIDACAALGIRPIVCRQERVGVGIADGFSRVKKGRVNGVFAAQHGPGIENAYDGVAQAFSENVPVLIIPAAHALSRQSVRPSYRAAESMASVSKYAALASNVQQLPSLMRRAFQALRELIVRGNLPPGSWIVEAEIAERLGLKGVDGVLLDLGVSSPQLEDAARVYRKLAERVQDHPDVFLAWGTLEGQRGNDKQAAALRTRRVRKLGALTLAEQTLPTPANAENATLLAEGIAALIDPDIASARAALEARLREFKKQPGWKDRYRIDALPDGTFNVNLISLAPGDLSVLKGQPVSVLNLEGMAITDGLFMTSRDGLRFHRWNEAFIKIGPERPADRTAAC